MAMGPGAAAPSEEGGRAFSPVTAGEKVWPSAPARYWALAVIVFATFMTFLDQIVFGMLAPQDWPGC